MAKDGSRYRNGPKDLELTPELHGVIGHLLRKAHLTAQKCFADAFAGTNLSPVQYALTSVVAGNPGVSHKHLAAAVATTASVATTALKPLLRQGLVLNRRDRTDTRSTTYRISKRGFALLKQSRKRLAIASKVLEAPLSKTEAGELRMLLTKLIDGTSARPGRRRKPRKRG